MKEDFPPIHYPGDYLNANDPHGFAPFKRRITKTKGVILHFDRSTGALIPFEWCGIHYPHQVFTKHSQADQ